MKDNEKTRETLVRELTKLRSQYTALEKSIPVSISANLAADESIRYAESIFETIREPLLVLDADLKIISANRNFYRTFEVNPVETIGRFIFDLGNKEWDIHKLRVLLEEILPEKRVFDNFEVTHDFQNIGHRVMLLNARQIYREEIGEKMILLAIEDITERKRLEDLLMESEGRYKHAFDSARDGIVLFEKREGKITQANPAAEKILGYSPEESIGKKLQDIGIVDIDDFQTIMQILDKSGFNNYIDVPIKTKSGQQIDTDIYLVDRARLVQCNIRDVSLRTQDKKDIRELLAAVQQEKNRLSALINSIPDEIWFADTQKRFTLANPLACKQFNLDPDQSIDVETLAKSLVVLRPDGSPRPVEEAPPLRALLGEVVISQEEIVQLPASGELRHRQVNSVPVKDTSGSIIGAVSVVRDITDYKRVQKQANERMKELQTFYDLAEITGRAGIILDSMYQECTNILPQSWQYPEITCARIVIGDSEFRTENFSETPWMQAAPIRVKGSVLGRIDVGYLEERPEEADGPFLKEEKRLIDAIAERLGHFIERKQSEEALQQSEAKFRNYMESAPDGVFVVDDSGQYIEANESACRITGYPKEEIEKISIHDLLAEESLGEGLAHFKKLMETGEATADLWHKHKDGSKRCLAVSAVKLSETRFLGFFKDITKNKNAEENLKETLESLRKAVGVTIQVMASAVESRDPYTYGHQSRSADLARAIATEMGLPQCTIEGIRMAATIHDIGKLSIPAEILSKPNKLSEIELLLVQEHVNKGFNILKAVVSPWPLAEIVHQHHERLDGSGYPRNLKGEEICMEARILTVADVVEAMASHRPYRAGLGIDAALEEIENNRGTLYDNTVADACLRLFREKGFQLAGI